MERWIRGILRKRKFRLFWFLREGFYYEPTK
jgi:hypothetical protein